LNDPHDGIGGLAKLGCTIHGVDDRLDCLDTFSHLLRRGWLQVPPSVALPLPLSDVRFDTLPDVIVGLDSRERPV
jgi:hypothetical protein